MTRPTKRSGPPIPDHFLDVYAAGEAIGASHATIRKYIQEGVLTHYRTGGRARAYRVDPAELDRIPRPKRFWDQVIESDGGCWLWSGRQHKGYGMHNSKLAHRVAYEAVVGPIPNGLELDHLCVTPLCVNPDHLEPVTRLVNMRRRFDRLTHCKHGHEFTPANTYLREGYYRTCRECVNEAQRRYQAKKKSA